MNVAQNVNMRISTISGPKLDVAGTGFTVLDKIYQDGELADEALGGSCANVLVSLAMLDRHVAPVLRLGDDDEGDLLVNEFSDAGAVTEYISRHRGLRSPILSEDIDTTSSEHHFSFICKETNTPLPTYEPIGRPEFSNARPVLRLCSIFFADRLSPTILDAMELAYRSGAVVVFEPSAVDDKDLFIEALRLTTVLKSSADRLDDELNDYLKIFSPQVRVTTHGADGLRISDTEDDFWCDAVPVTKFRDACGSGDMVTVGMIDWLLTLNLSSKQVSARSILDGVVAGQHLASANCAFEGARGLFRHLGASYARAVLSK